MRGAPGGREARTASSPPSSSLVDMTNETRCGGRKGIKWRTAAPPRPSKAYFFALLN
jgi:hypothetical protein